MTQPLPFTVFLNAGAKDILPVLVAAKDEASAFIAALDVFKQMFPGYSGPIHGIKTTMGWAVAYNQNMNLH